PLEDCDTLTPQRCLKVLSLFRFLHPRTEIRIAGGREHNLRSLQPLALYPADSVFVNGYLTTPGAPAPEVWGMIEDLGFRIEVDYQQPAALGHRFPSGSPTRLVALPLPAAERPSETENTRPSASQRLQGRLPA
ncbi:MAG: hypothetical protein ICV75_02010, partial [Nitrospiraceae bacterium]|nr:hypothetical protein [Nitrospiraceae bacterium]